MRRERHIIDSDGWLRVVRVASSVLGANEGGGVKEGGGDQVGVEANEVECRIGEIQADCGAAADVKQGLRVAGKRPGDCAATLLVFGELGREGDVEGETY